VVYTQATAASNDGERLAKGAYIESVCFRKFLGFFVGGDTWIDGAGTSRTRTPSFKPTDSSRQLGAPARRGNWSSAGPEHHDPDFQANTEYDGGWVDRLPRASWLTCAASLFTLILLWVRVYCGALCFGQPQRVNTGGTPARWDDDYVITTPLIAAPRSNPFLQVKQPGQAWFREMRPPVVGRFAVRLGHVRWTVDVARDSIVQLVQVGVGVPEDFFRGAIRPGFGKPGFGFRFRGVGARPSH